MHRSTLTPIVLLLLIWMLAAAGCAGQDVGKGKAAPAAPAAKATEPAGKAAPAPDAGKGPGAHAKPAPPAPAASPAPVAAPGMAGAAALRWHDGIHYLGLVNAVLAVLTLLGGLVLFLGFQVQGKKWNEPARKTIRAVHMTAGTIAIAAGLAHYLGRSVQIGHLWWGPNPPTFAMLGFLLLLISGILRYKKPWAIMPWLHRVGFVVALLYLTKHSLYQYHRFMGPKP